MFLFVVAAVLLFISAALGYAGYMPIENEFKNRPWTLDYKRAQAKINAILGLCFLVCGVIVTYFVRNVFVGIVLILIFSIPCIVLSFKTKVYYLNKIKKKKEFK